MNITKSTTTTAAAQQELPLLQKLRNLVFNISFRQHLIFSVLIRLALIWYGQFHDAHSEVPYTDVDYKVVTDGARHILGGRSPFHRHTYRYSPILAYLQIPNVLIHPAIGKIIYSSFDIFVAILIYTFVYDELKSQCRKAVESLLQKLGKSAPKNTDNDSRNRPEIIARASACFWLYNPLTAVISTRGNGDSFSSFFVILSLYLLAKSDDVAQRNQKHALIFAAGFAHGFAIHLRLYPLLFSLAYYLCLSEHLTRNLRDFLCQLLVPTTRQFILVLGTLLGVCLITGFFYKLYGWQYIYEAYIYHFVRKDVRHNFSLYFLLQYLDNRAATAPPTFFIAVLYKCMILAPQVFLLLYITFSFGQFRQTLPFCIFSLAFVMVTFNTVVTSQYFVWYLALLPLCLNNLQSLAWSKAFVLSTIWLLAQAFWLIPAYLLEFKTQNTFYWIGIQGAVFCLVNNIVLMCLIQHFSFTSFKVNFRKLF